MVSVAVVYRPEMNVLRLGGAAVGVVALGLGIKSSFYTGMVCTLLDVRFSMLFVMSLSYYGH